MLTEEETDNRKLRKQIEKLQYAESALINLNESLIGKKQECRDLSHQLKDMLEQLFQSEYSIKKFLRSLQDQDDIHEEHINFFRQSEILLKKYYEEKIKFCLEQIALREPKTASVEIQTDNTFDEELTQKYENQIKKLDIQLRKQIKIPKNIMVQIYLVKGLEKL
jgi:hypothetical protein